MRPRVLCESGEITLHVCARINVIVKIIGQVAFNMKPYDKMNAIHITYKKNVRVNYAGNNRVWCCVWCHVDGFTLHMYMFCCRNVKVTRKTQIYSCATFIAASNPGRRKQECLTSTLNVNVLKLWLDLYYMQYCAQFVLISHLQLLSNQFRMTYTVHVM